MKALVTGAGGFTGSYLVPHLQSRNVEVHAVTAKPLRGVVRHAVPWEDTRALAKLLRDVRPDFLFHLAGTNDTSRLADLVRVNALYAANLFDAMGEARTPVPTLVVGSAAEYGSASGPAVTEAVEPRPRTPYGASKYLQTVNALLAAERGIPVVVARPFNLIGSGLPNTLVLGRFLEQLDAVRRGRADAILMGNLQSSRDFVDVKDAVEIYEKLLRAPAAFGKVVHVCTGRATRVRDLLFRLRDLCSVKADIREDSGRPGATDPDMSSGSTERLLGLIGGFPFTGLEETLRRIAGELPEGTLRVAANR